MRHTARTTMGKCQVWILLTILQVISALPEPIPQPEFLGFPVQNYNGPEPEPEPETEPEPEPESLCKASTIETANNKSINDLNKGPFFLYLSDTHILQLPSFTRASCRISPYPVKDVDDAVAGVVDSKLHSCGGYKQSTCYALLGTCWKELPSLSVNRYDAAGSITEAGWLVTGGLDRRSNRLSSSDLYTDGVWTSGPTLPAPTYGHCQVTDGSKVIVTGGITDIGRTGATYSLDGLTWTQLSTMVTARYYHGCVLVNSTLYVVGGYGSGGWLSSVEKLDLSTGVWSAGPDLPNAIVCVQTVQYDGDVYVVGGGGPAYDGEILKLEGNSWVTVANTGYNGDRVVSHPPIISGDQVDCD